MDEEIRYIDYAPEDIWTAGMEAYVNAGGDILYPGDEKEMLLRAVQAVIVQGLAAADTALCMATLRGAKGRYLDDYGEKRFCERLEARAAACMADIVFAASGISKTLQAGMEMTADGEMMYALAEDVRQTGAAQTVRVRIVCTKTGRVGNGLIAGTPLRFMIPNAAILSVTAATDASGGQDEEDDESYRARIHEYGLTNKTTGPQEQYERVSMAVSSEIIDAYAIKESAGTVGVYILPASDVGTDALLQSVRDALTPDSVRPLTDNVNVYASEAMPYTLHVQYKQEEGADIADAVAQAIAQYSAWQDNTIGRAFNPDKLMAMVYQAGAIRVTWGEDSAFGENGDVAYTEIGATAHCKGTITAEEVAG